MGKFVRFAQSAAAVFGTAFCVLTAAAGGEGPTGQAILTEASVWRAHMTWGPVMQQTTAGVQPGKFGSQLKFSTEPPPQDWARPEFVDGGWGLWRETHAVEMLKGTDVRLYDTRQYGMQLSRYLRRLCLRGRFEVAEAAGVRGLRLNVIYRGGIAVYLNGQEVGRGSLSKETEADPLGSAEVYPKEVYLDLAGKPWGLKSGSIGTIDLKDGPAVERFNLRMRQLAVEVPASALRKGVNVLALDLRAAPYRDDVEVGHDWWGACGVASVQLSGEGAVTPAVTRPPGVQVWAASPLFKASPFGSIIQGRIGNGAQVYLYSFPLCWTGCAEGTGSIRMVGTRNGVFTGQVVVSSAGSIRGLKAEPSDLALKGGGGTIPAANCEVGYMTFPPEPPGNLMDLSVSLLDMLHDRPPAEVPALPATPAKSSSGMGQGGVSWCDGGATMPVWLRVRVPRDAPEGEYTGTLTVSCEGLKPTAVPVSLKVHGYVLPDPRDFYAQAALVHSPDTLALKYNVPLWSDRHFELMDKTCARMGELGGSLVIIPLVTDTWLGNSQTMVSWGKDGGPADFKVLDRYLDMVQKHMKPRAVCLYVVHPYKQGGLAGSVSTAGGTVSAPAYAPTPEAVAFWKPVLAEVLSRLKTRGLDKCVTVGLTVEGGGRTDMQPAVDLFKEVWPEGKWADLAHYGARKGNICGVPYGYTMSVWGNQTPFASKKWGQPDLPLVVVKHYRADRIIDLRPIVARGPLYWATEQALRGMHGEQVGAGAQGIGPLGMDFWNLPNAGGAGGRGPGPVERYVTNITMSGFSTAALLAPGPEGPLPTARFEIFRQGLQVCEARTAIERAREDGKLGGELAKRCEDALKRRADTYTLMRNAELFGQGEGWRWFETSGWEDATGELFALAGEVAKATGK